MTGSLRQRGIDSWELRVYLGVDPERGRERWTTKTVHGTRRYATARLAEFVEEAGYARLRAGTVADLLDRWLAHASTVWSASTLRETRSIVEHHLKPHLGHLAVNKLTTVDIDDLYQHLLRGGGRDGRPLAPGTVHRVHVVLHRALTQALRWEWVWLNPARAASPPRVAPAEVRPPSPEQVHRLLAHVEDRDPDFAIYLWLAASTGARRSQLLGLRWREVDIAHAAIGFTRASVEGPTGPVLRATKSHRVYRVAIDEATIRRLVVHRRRAEARAAGHGLRLCESAFVFSSQADGSWPWLPNRVTKTFLAHRRSAGVGAFRLHDLRHSWPLRCLTPACPSPPCPNGWGTRGPRQRSTSTATRPRQRRRCRRVHRHTDRSPNDDSGPRALGRIGAARWANGHVVDGPRRGLRTRHDGAVKQGHRRPGDEPDLARRVMSRPNVGGSAANVRWVSELGGEPREGAGEFADQFMAGDRPTCAFGDHGVEYVAHPIAVLVEQPQGELVGGQGRDRRIECLELVSESPVVARHDVRFDGDGDGGDVPVLPIHPGDGVGRLRVRVGVECERGADLSGPPAQRRPVDVGEIGLERALDLIQDAGRDDGKGKGRGRTR